jgi:hypothetical protein
METFLYCCSAFTGLATILFMWSVSSINSSMKTLHKMERSKMAYNQEVTEPITTVYKGAVVTIFPSGQFTVHGSDDAHAKRIYDEVKASFDRRYICG